MEESAATVPEENNEAFPVGKPHHVENKTNWHDIYSGDNPLPYFRTMSQFDYGFFQDRFLEIIVPHLDKVFGKETPLRTTEIGCLFGNTAMAYKFGLTWAQTGAFWEDETAQPTPIRPMHITGCDLAVGALEYGKRRGVYDETVLQDFNQPLTPSLIQNLGESDLLVLIMISSYIHTPSFLMICLNFLRDRTRRKVITYNDTCAFDTRNWSPEAMFSNLKGWTATSHFVKHRNFTEEERATRHGCTESWSYCWVVTFEPL